ncbi:MAG: hypothetical protein OEZ22_13770 [Spirochaetia bacterium]|nr:hypothetical protein [Spirochaetia bacterium]
MAEIIKKLFTMKRYLNIFFWPVVFAVSMAYLEAAIVVYLRELYYPDNILKIFPLKIFSTSDYSIEIGREIATVIMLLSAARIIEKNNSVRFFAAFVFLFGVWDAFYYIWLKVMINWPVELLEWDLLFLIPWAWAGPWICPVLISILFIVWGGYILLLKENIIFLKRNKYFFIGGCITVLFTFLYQPFLILLNNGADGFISYIPDNFMWEVFIIGFIIMTRSLPWNNDS